MSRRTNSERVVYSLTLDLPPGVSCTRMKAYIEHAIVGFRGGLLSDDPMTSFKAETLKLKLLERHTKYV